jgi:hypothetical protein
MRFMVAPPNLNTIPCRPLLYGWSLSIPSYLYVFGYCLTLAILLRILHSTWRALAIQRGDFPESNPRNTPRHFWRALSLCFWGINQFKEHSDLWLPTLIGWTELSIYPVLIAMGRYEFIGGWILVKAAGGWTGYAQSRTSFNRFLFFNLVTLITACGLSLFVDPTPCARLAM